MKHLALHTCCAPCLIGVYAALTQDLLQEGERISAVFYNPNIAPAEEYLKRRDACRGYAYEQGIDFVEIKPIFTDWTDKESPKQRCQSCYDLRLSRVAQWAHDNDCDALATTLSISPWQNLEAIKRTGKKAASNFSNLHFAHYDFRNYYRGAQKKARDLKIYCQNYCGCLPSKAEAEAQRAARRKGK